MFTGIVEEVGRIITADRKGNSARLKIEAEKVLEDIKLVTALPSTESVLP